MSCYHPLKAIDFGINSSGKHSIKVLKGEFDPFEKPTVKNAKFIPLPCGKCIGCRLDYSRQWADRCFLESKYHDENWFLTLTFDDEHLPPKYKGSDINSLRKSDVQKFMKDLRNKVFERYVYGNEFAKLYYSKKKGSKWRLRFKNDYPEQYVEFEKNKPVIRFFACGEYGKTSFTTNGISYGRPHYHLLLFGLRLDDVELFKFDRKQGFGYYTSQFINSLWDNGFHILTKLTWNTCAYTARYIVKKQKGENSDKYKILNYEPEFVLMSRKPGIGYQFFKDNPDIVKESFYVSTFNGSKRISSNRYFDKLFSDIDKDQLEMIKFDRSMKALDNLALKMNNSSYSYKELNNAAEINKLESIKSLKRKEV